MSIADVAAKTGLPIHLTSIELNRIALETKAVMEVSNRGQIVYKFFPDLDSIYRLVGIRKIVMETLHAAYEAGFFLLRMSFGVLLVVSFVTIAVVFTVALIIILCGMDAADGEGDLDLQEGLDFEFFDFEALGMFFGWGIFTGGETPESYCGVQIEQPDRGFFSNCFSFLFGEGNPNRDIEEEQFKLAADLIRRNNGAVTAEQLAPYLVSAKVSDYAVLPILVRFNGCPEVSPKGTVVYTFPELQVTASGLNQVAALYELQPSLKEKDWIFTKVPTEKLHWVFFFAGANLCGAYALNQHLAWFQPLLPFKDQVHAIMAYAIFFMGFPILREFYNLVRNAIIDVRNKFRERAAKEVHAPKNQMKIAEARQFAQQMVNIASGPMVYTTSTDILGQDTDGLGARIDQELANYVQPVTVTVLDTPVEAPPKMLTADQGGLPIQQSPQPLTQSQQLAQLHQQSIAQMNQQLADAQTKKYPS